MLALVWTHHGTGIMKYIQWIVTRKLGNIRMVQLNDDCEVISQSDLSSMSNDNSKYVYVYFVSLTANMDRKLNCFMELERIIKSAYTKINQVYFKRRSIQATLLYQQLDTIRRKQNLSIENMKATAHSTTEHLITYFTSNGTRRAKIIDSEDMVHSNLVDIERVSKDFMAFLGFDVQSNAWLQAIQYDSHQFSYDATWWDQSDTVERIQNRSQRELNSFNFTDVYDFRRFDGRRSFTQYLSDNRQCFTDGIFPQLPSETNSNRSSTDKPERCSLKPFDCAFSDLFSFADREQMYESYDVTTFFHPTPLKCAFTIHSTLDKVRQRYGRNHTCETVFFTSVTECYDPLPTIQGSMPLHSCFVALLDKKTINAYEKFYLTRNKSNNANIQWDIIDLELNVSLFRVLPKLTETLKLVGHRLFPMAKWIIWLDGKAQVTDLGELLLKTRVPVLGPYHPDSRTPEAEVEPTVRHVTNRNTGNLQSLLITIQEIELQQAQYRRNGFYARTNNLGLRIYDIASLIYRNNHPCVARYFCGWHNEVNYYSFRGQLSVYYSAVRLNLTDYFDFIPSQCFFGADHRPVC